MTIDELAAAAGTTTRRIRSLQTLGLLPHPELRGRTGLYGAAHGTAWPPFSASRDRASPSSRSACSSTPSGRGGRWPPSSGSPSPGRHGHAGRGRRRGRGRALRLRRAPAGRAATARGRGRALLSVVPTTVWDESRGVLTRAGAPPAAVRALGRVGSRARLPAVPLVHWEEAAALRSRGGRDDPARRRVGGPRTTRSTSGCTWATAPTTSWSTGPGPPRPSASGSTRMVFARQVHGASAALVGPDDRGRGTAVGGRRRRPTPTSSVTTSPGVTLVDPGRRLRPARPGRPGAGVLAAVHAGWRGTAAGAVEPRAALPWTDCGARPSGCGPSSGPPSHPDRYQVSDEVHVALSGAVGARRPRPRAWRGPTAPGHWLVDLVAANRQQLLAGGRPRGPHRRQRRQHRRRGLLQRSGPTALRAVRPAGAPCRLRPGRRRLRRSMGGPGPPGTPPPAMPPHDRFRYDGFAIDPAASVVTCNYSTGGHTFTERFTFADGRRLGGPGRGAAVRILFLLAGVSYYKTTAAPVIDLGDLPTTAAERRLPARLLRQRPGRVRLPQRPRPARRACGGPGRRARPTGPVRPGAGAAAHPLRRRHRLHRDRRRRSPVTIPTPRCASSTRPETVSPPSRTRRP